jgi:hypothetical protein
MPLTARPSDGEEEEEAPTRLMPLSTLGDVRKIAPPENTYVPPPRKRPRRRWPALALAVGGLLVVGALGGVAFSLVRLVGEEDAPRAIASPRPEAPADEPPAEAAATPIELRVESEPEGAVVHVDGRSVEGATPLTVTLPPDARHVWLRLSKPGYVDQEREVSATVGAARFVLPPLAVDDRPAEAGGDEDADGEAPINAP